MALSRATWRRRGAATALVAASLIAGGALGTAPASAAGHHGRAERAHGKLSGHSGGKLLHAARRRYRGW